MANQITCCMQFFTDPKSSAPGHLIKRHNRCILNKDNKPVSVFSPGVARASKLQTALWRNMVAAHHTAWGNQLQRWQDSLLERENKLCR